MEQPRARSSFAQRSRCRTCRVTRLFGHRSDLLSINVASSQSPGGSFVGSGRKLIFLCADEQRPDNARVLRREGDRRDAIGPPPPQTFRPASLGIAARGGHTQQRGGAVGEQGAQVHVAVLGHAAASLASFFPDSRNARTNSGAMTRDMCPSAASSRESDARLRTPPFPPRSTGVVRTRRARCRVSTSAAAPPGLLDPPHAGAPLALPNPAPTVVISPMTSPLLIERANSIVALRCRPE